MAFIGLPLHTSTGARLSQGRKLEEDRGFLGIYQGDSPATLHVQGQVKDPSNLLLFLHSSWGKKVTQVYNNISLAYPPSSELPQPETVSTAQEPFVKFFLPLICVIMV